MENRITLDKLVRWVGLTLLVVAALFTLNYLSGVLLPFFIAWFFAYLLYPVVKFVQYKMRVKVRALAIIITMLMMIGILALVMMFIIPPMIDQFESLGKFVLHYITTAENEKNSVVAIVNQFLRENQREIEAFFRSPDFVEAVKAALPKVFSFVGHTASIIWSIVGSCIMLLYMFFILLDYEYLTDSWIKIFPKKVRPFWRDVMHDVERALNNYIRGQGMVALCMGIMFCIGFTIIDFPMAIGLGILIGIMDLVPYLHTFALIPTAFLALMKSAETGQNFFVIFGLALVVFAVVQVITDMVTTPKIMGKAMNLNPAVLLLSLSIWGSLLGFIGLIIALPLTTLIMAYWKRYITKEDEAAPQPPKGESPSNENEDQ